MPDQLVTWVLEAFGVPVAVHCPLCLSQEGRTDMLSAFASFPGIPPTGTHHGCQCDLIPGTSDEIEDLVLTLARSNDWLEAQGYLDADPVRQVELLIEASEKLRAGDFG